MVLSIMALLESGGQNISLITYKKALLALLPKNIGKNLKSACIVICDLTRPVPNRMFLKPIITRLLSGGIPLEGITILIATGLHRPNVGVELDELIGDQCLTESSGGINEETLVEYAKCGVDYISSGALTHSVYNMDLSLKAV